MERSDKRFILPWLEGSAVFYGDAWVMKSKKEVTRFTTLLAVDFGGITNVGAGEDIIPEQVFSDDRIYLVLFWTDQVGAEVMEMVDMTVKQYGGVHCTDKQRRLDICDRAHQQLIDEVDEIRRRGALN